MFLKKPVAFPQSATGFQNTVNTRGHLRTIKLSHKQSHTSRSLIYIYNPFLELVHKINLYANIKGNIHPQTSNTHFWRVSPSNIIPVKRIQLFCSLALKVFHCLCFWLWCGLWHQRRGWRQRGWGVGRKVRSQADKLTIFKFKELFLLVRLFTLQHLKMEGNRKSAQIQESNCTLSF